MAQTILKTKNQTVIGFTARGCFTPALTAPVARLLNAARLLQLLIAILTALTGHVSLASPQVTTQASRSDSPALLFHAGKRRLLEQDIAAKTIPRDVWDRFIMGVSTHYDLPDYRKGLYGSRNIPETSLYGFESLLVGELNWVMIIRVKPECLEHQAIDDSSFKVLSGKSQAPGPFGRWYHTNRTRYRGLENKCLNSDARDAAWEEGVGYSLTKADPETQERTRVCTQVLDDYLRESKRKVVFDSFNGEDSWYLRDQNCIASITGTADDWFKILFQTFDEYGSPKFDAFGGPEPGVRNLATSILITQVLAETKELKKANLPALRRWLKAFDIESGNQVQHLSRSAQDLRTAPHSLNSGWKYDLSRDDEYVAQLVRSAVACTEKQQLPRFQQTLSNFVKASPRLIQLDATSTHGENETPHSIFTAEKTSAAITDLIRSVQLLCGN